MPDPRDLLSPADDEERLRRLGRQWFADVRQQNAEDEVVSKMGRAKSSGGDYGNGDLFDSIFGGDGDGDD